MSTKVFITMCAVILAVTIILSTVKLPSFTLDFTSHPGEITLVVNK